MTIAQVGPFTTVIEALATAVGAAALLGGVAAGILGLVRGSSRADLEENALVSGYIGGGLGAIVALIDTVLRYALVR